MDNKVKIRDRFTDTVKKLLVGPNPLEEFRQDNGEEILFNGSPLNNIYVTGILFPQNNNRIKGVVELRSADNEEAVNGESDTVDEYRDPSDKNIDSGDVIDAETAKINARYQSAMGITLCVPNRNGISIKISAGTYEGRMSDYPNRVEKKEEGQRIIKNSGKEKIWQNNLQGMTITALYT